jgi:pyridinium-3,5-bisthiocarboxylic acid mononucleotide nickel chelatase
VSLTQGLHLHFDCPSGAAGDMTLGALFDMGVPVEAVRAALAKLPVDGYTLDVRKGTRRGLAGTDVRVLIETHDDHHDDHHDDDHHHEGDAHGRHGRMHDKGHAHRHYADIRKMLALLDGETRRLAEDIFQRVAVAEAKLHATTVDDVAFHEVGAIDSIVDIVGTAAAIAWLAPASVSATPPALGHGTIKVAHGTLPIPAPATLEICRAAGMPTIDGDAEAELLTPTGAAILASIVTSWGPMPPVTVRGVGYGAGDNELPDRPNLLRAVAGTPVSAHATETSLLQLEANLDDMSPELCEHVAERLFAAGAVDVWWTPALMKKSRPAFVLGALVPPARRDEAAEVILLETTSLGVRWSAVERRVLERRSETVQTPHGPVSVKLGLLAGRVVNVAPEYESCRVIARDRGVPLKDVYRAALAAFQSK